LKLLDMIVESWPGEANAAVHQQRAECLRDLRRDHEATAAYRATFAEQRRRSSYLTNAHLDFAWWIATSDRRELFDEALAVLEEFSRGGAITFPATVYLAEGTRAIIEHARGSKARAAMHARLALEAANARHSGLRYHPKVGLLESRDEEAHAKLVAISAG
jgi:hypothetical protein